MSRLGSQTREALGRLGYEPAHIRAEFPVLTERGSVVADLVAFGRPNGPHDASTATLIVEVRRRVSAGRLEHLHDMAVALGVPAALVASDDGWELYAVNEGLTAIQREPWTTDVAELRHALNPRALLAAKLGGRQLTLFPAAAVVSARGRALRERALAPRVVSALSAAASTMLETATPEDQSSVHARAARLVIGALTAVVLRDKDNQRLPHGNPGAVIDTALQRHPEQFDWMRGLQDVEQQLLDALVSELSDLDYTSVEPELLSQLYEQQLLDDASRRRLGTHYTPPGLARRLIAWLPIEEIEPSARMVFDPTCGSGSLLIAAHDRLRDLEPEDRTLPQVHADLVARLRGTDVDPIAVAIARLALFLNALPAGNGWKITQDDYLAHPAPPVRASIIVANPPWAYSNTARQDDLAQHILRRVIEDLTPGGLLGILLPSGWLTRRNPTARHSRELVKDSLDLLEVWRLPQGTFASGELGAAVLLAQKPMNRLRRKTFVQRRVTDKSQLITFYESGGSNQAFVSHAPGVAPLLGGPLSSWYLGIETQHTHSLGDYANVVVGPQPESPQRLMRREPVATQPNALLVEWRDVKAFARVATARHRPVRFPEDMQGGSARGKAIVGHRKVLVSGVKNPERPWRLKVAIDDDGAFLVRNTVSAVLPKVDPHGAVRIGESILTEDVVLYGLFAFVGSGFASAWLDETDSTRYISPDDLRSMPVPDPPTMTVLAEVGTRLATDGASENLLEELESVVWSWLNPPDEVKSAVIARLNEAPGPEGRLRYAVADQYAVAAPAPLSEASDVAARAQPPAMLRAGAVLEVKGQSVKLVLPGRTSDDGATVRLPMRMPGALLEPPASFIAIDDGSPLDSLCYVFDQVAYLSDDQVAALLANPQPQTDAGSPR